MNQVMKNYFFLFLAGIIGGVTVLGLQSILTPETIINQNDHGKAIHVNSKISATTLPFDFVVASEKSKKCVVHILSEGSPTVAQGRRSQSPFEQLFGNDMFNEDFFQGFGQNFFQPRNGMGSGVIISEDGYIVTNNHVVGFAEKITVTLEDGRKVDAKKIGTDPTTDLAVIKIELDERLPAIKFADSDNVRVGEWALAVGNPFSYLTSTVTAGIVSAKGRDLDIIKEDKAIEEFIQTDAAVNPGNSGGALVDAKGDLIGINTAIATPTGTFAGYSFAIPANLVKRIVEDIKKNGNIERVNLGIGGWDVKEVKEELKLDADHGFYVEQVQRGSSAQLSGILPGDIILEINGKAIHRFDDITENMKYTKAGDQVSVKVNRKGKEKIIKIGLMNKF